MGPGWRGGGGGGGANRPGEPGCIPADRGRLTLSPLAREKGYTYYFITHTSGYPCLESLSGCDFPDL